MNAVVLTVKSSYVASTKYPRQGADLQKVIFDFMMISLNNNFILNVIYLIFSLLFGK